jgi:hypothetical protein
MESAVNANGATMFPHFRFDHAGATCRSICRAYAKGSPNLSKSYVCLCMFAYPVRASRRHWEDEHDAFLHAP